MLSKGERLEKKGDYEKSSGKHLYSYREAAEWFSQHRQYIDAARCWDKLAMGSGDRTAIENAVSCYKAAKSFEDAALYCLRHNKRSEAIKIYENMEDRDKGLTYLLGLGTKDKDGCLLFHALDLVLKFFPKEKAKEWIKKNWANLVEVAKASEGSYFDCFGVIWEDNRRILLSFLKLFEGDKFLMQIVATWAEALIWNGDLTGYKLREELGKLLKKQNFDPLAVANIYRIALDHKIPIYENTSWKDSEDEWLQFLTEEYIQGGENEKAVEAYLSRQKYAEAAEVLENIGRFKEALDLLNKLGPGDYILRGTGFVSATTDIIKQYWEKKICELKNKDKIKEGEQGEPIPEKPCYELKELEQMFALGEITKEEYEKMKKDIK